MNTADSARTLAHLFSELIDGVAAGGGGFMLNTGDAGLLASLDKLSPDDASRNIAGGATIAAHAQHVRYGLSLMNQWAAEGGNPFANARWDEAWKISRVDGGQWAEIRNGLGEETHRWLDVLKTPREVAGIEFTGMVASIAHLAYHLGAIRQINKDARGPREGTFDKP
jgi:hypothetical protein